LLKLYKSAYLQDRSSAPGLRFVSRPYNITEMVTCPNIPATELIPSICKNGPYDFIWAFASTLYQLAVTAKELNSIPQVGYLVSTGSTLWPSWKKTIEEIFQKPILQMYGSSELGCVATECTHGNLHWDLELCTPWFLENDKLINPHGKKGNLIVDSLYNWTSRIYHHDMGDILEFAPLDFKCGCNSSDPVILKIEGRNTYWLKTASGAILTDTLWNSVAFTSLLGQNIVKALQYYQWDSGLIEVRCVPGTQWDESAITRHMAMLDKTLQYKIVLYDDVTQLMKNGKLHVVERESY
jgi:phenylacetate-CoA ligase